jgi:MFS family permease
LCSQINAVLYFAPTIFSGLNVTSLSATTITGIFLFAATFLSLWCANPQSLSSCPPCWPSLAGLIGSGAVLIRCCCACALGNRLVDRVGRKPLLVMGTSFIPRACLAST